MAEPTVFASPKGTTMQVVTKKNEVMQWVSICRSAGSRIALVPTMGYLHQGHLDLIREARNHADRVAVSIFVNPTQFGPKEDLSSYPRSLQQDLKRCEAEGADLVFAPEDGEMYDADHSTWVNEDSVSLGLCGRSRPGHFRGVLTVVAKLFNLVDCDVAVFGQKDLQQVTLIEKMVRELDMSVRIVRVPIRREADGLAMSSRNAYLSPSERAVAPELHRSLETGVRILEQRKACEASGLLEAMSRYLSRFPDFRLDYLEIVDRRSLLPVEQAVAGQVVIAVAAFLGNTRLIDNIEA